MNFCIQDNCGKPVENRDLMLCSTHNKLRRKIDSVKLPEDPKPIKKVSDIMAKMLTKYAAQKKRWIKGKKCAVLKNVPATDVHHMAGRSIDAYYDEWAEQNGICLLLDERFWLPVSREGHIEITKRPEWAKRMGYSEDRLTKKQSV
jgi:hypothetical protein